MFSKKPKPLMFVFALTTGALINSMNAQALKARENGADIINNWVKSAEQSTFFKLSAGDVAYNAGSDVTLATNLTLTFTIDPQEFDFAKKADSETKKDKQKFIFSLNFPTVRFTNLTSDDTYYSVTKISAKTIEMTSKIAAGNQNIISTGGYTNFLATDLSWAKIPTIKQDPAKPASKYFPVVKALSDISFSLLRADKMEMVQKTIEPAMVTTTIYNEMIYKDVKHGNIAFSSISSAEIKTQGGPFSYNINVGPVTISDYKMGAIVKNFAPDLAPQENAPYKTVIGNMSIGKVDVKFKQGFVSIDAMSWQDISIRPTSVSFLKTLDRFVTNGFDTQETIPSWIGDLVRSSYGAFKLAKSEVRGVAFNVDGVVGKLDSVILKDFSSDGIGAYILSGFSVHKANEFDVSVARVSTLNVKFPLLKAVMEFAEAQKRNDITAMMKAIPILGEFSIKTVKADIAKMGKFAFDYAGYTMSGHIGPIPTNITTKLTGLVLPVAMLEGEVRDELSALGFETLKLSYADSFHWKSETSTLDVFSTIKMVDGGSYRFEATLGNIPKLIFTSPAAAPGLLIGATFNKASFTFNDDSIIDRLLSKFSKEQNIDVATLKERLVSIIPAGLAQFKNPNFTKSVSDAVRQLLDNKGAITATAKPENPTPVVELYSTFSIAPETLIDRLNVKVVAQ